MAKQEKLKISCRKVDCENGLHCYQITKAEAKRAWNIRSQLPDTKAGAQVGEGVALAASLSEIPVDNHGKPREGPVQVCKACGAHLVDWSRVHRQDLLDVEYTFNALKTEWIRHWFWHWPIDKRAVTYAYKKGKAGLKERVKTRIHKYVGHAPASELWREGRQTPFAEKPDAQNVIYCAQHATATCCRKCVEEWHKIPRDRPLTDVEEDYLTELAMRYILERLPGLTEIGGLAPSEVPALVAFKTPIAQLLDATSPAARSDAEPTPIASRVPTTGNATSTSRLARSRPSKRRSL